MAQIPVVDISRIGIGRQDGEVTERDLLAVGSELKSAFSEFGFVYLSGHGFPSGLPGEVFEEARRFFTGHTVEEKVKSFPYHRVNLWGYTPPGDEKLDEHKEKKTEKKATHELREALDATRLEDGDPMPDDLAPKIRPLFRRLRDAFLPLSNRVLRSLSISLGLDPDFLPSLHGGMIKRGNRAVIRTLYYPPITGDVVPGVTRCGEHFDYGTLTFLVQDDIGGLEVKSRGEGWIRARPIPGTILVNIGDELEILTNGLFPATLHRVVVPQEEVGRGQCRQSIGFFANTDDAVLLEPIKGEEPKLEKYGPISSKDHMDMLCKKARGHLDEKK